MSRAWCVSTCRRSSYITQTVDSRFIRVRVRLHISVFLYVRTNDETRSFKVILSWNLSPSLSLGIAQSGIDTLFRCSSSCRWVVCRVWSVALIGWLYLQVKCMYISFHGFRFHRNSVTTRRFLFSNFFLYFNVYFFILRDS